jgi:hypothetical protein
MKLHFRKQIMRSYNSRKLHFIISEVKDLKFLLLFFFYRKIFHILETACARTSELARVNLKSGTPDTTHPVTGICESIRTTACASCHGRLIVLVR